jgi:flagellar protein FliS
MVGNSYLKAYKKNGLDTDLAVADGHRVIQLLYQGLIESIVRAKASIERNDIEGKAKQINKALNIVAGLSSAVQYDPNDPVQVKVAQSFKDLYAIYNDRLMQASFELKTEPLDEILVYARDIKQAWDNIPLSQRDEGYRLQAARDANKV